MDLRARRATTCSVAAVLLGLLCGSIASGHPLGNISTNQLSDVGLWPDRVQIGYVVDLAEIPSAREIRRIDADLDGHVDDQERQRYELRAIRAHAFCQLKRRFPANRAVGLSDTATRHNDHSNSTPAHGMPAPSADVLFTSSK